MSQMDKLTVPKKLKVGFNSRPDTYGEKLAFVTYIDNKGKLRQESSWKGWIDETKGIEDHDNEPVSGIVLNQKVGGGGGRWAREVKVRAFDPRGFEIEITVENLLFILEECTSTKGKGLEGDFVYAWYGKQIVLLPVGSKEYKESVNYTEDQVKKVTKNKMKVGCLYKTKEGDEVIYLGRHDWWDYDWRNCNERHFVNKKYHIFYSVKTKIRDEEDEEDENKDKDERYYICFDGFTKLAEVLSEEPIPGLAMELERLKKHPAASKPVKIIPTKGTQRNHYDRLFHLIDGKLYASRVETRRVRKDGQTMDSWRYYSNGYYDQNSPDWINKKYIEYNDNPIVLVEDEKNKKKAVMLININPPSNTSNREYTSQDEETEGYYPMLENEQGIQFRINEYRWR